jgi:hypothetical protein
MKLPREEHAKAVNSNGSFRRGAKSQNKSGFEFNLKF